MPGNYLQIRKHLCRCGLHNPSKSKTLIAEYYSFGGSGRRIPQGYTSKRPPPPPSRSVPCLLHNMSHINNESYYYDINVLGRGTPKPHGVRRFFHFRFTLEATAAPSSSAFKGLHHMAEHSKSTWCTQTMSQENSFFKCLLTLK